MACPWTAGGSDSCNNYGHCYIHYSAAAWWRFASEGDRGRIERFIGRLRRSGYLPKEAPTAAEMVNEAETRLFMSVRCDSLQSARTEKASAPSKTSQV